MESDRMSKVAQVVKLAEVTQVYQWYTSLLDSFTTSSERSIGKLWATLPVKIIVINALTDDRNHRQIWVQVMSYE